MNSFGYFMSTTAGVLCFALLLLLWLIGPFIMKKACERKGYTNGEGHVFAACFLLGFVGYLYAICLPDLEQQETLDKLLKEYRKSNNTTPVYTPIVDAPVGSNENSSVSKSEPSNVWVCTKCGSTNPTGTFLCRNCGK